MQSLKVETKQAVKDINTLINEYIKLKKQLTGTGDEGKASFRKIETAVKGLQGASRNLTSEFMKLNKAYKNVSKSQKSFVTQTRHLKEQLKATQIQLQLVTAQLEKMKQKSKGIFTGMIASAKRLVSAFGALTGIALFAQAIRSAFVLTKQLDSMAFAMKAVIRNVVELAQTETWLKEVTKDFGAELITTTNRYIKFRAAANQAGLTAKETQEIFGTMTKVSGVLGLKTDELTGIYLALEQMVSKGKVTTEELRRQLGERLPGAMDIMANSMGVTTAKLDEMMKKGEVITKEVLPGFAKQVNIAFGLDSISKVDTLQAATIRLRNAWTILVEDFKKGNSASQRLTELFDGLANNLERIIQLVYRGIQAFLLYRAALSYAALNTALLTKIQLVLSAAFWKNITAVMANTAAYIAQLFTVKGLMIALRGLWATMLANPLFLLVGIVTTLVLVFKDWGKSVLEVSQEITKLGDQVKKQAQNNYELSASVKGLIDRYRELKKAIKLTPEEKDELKEVIDGIGKAFPQASIGVDKFGRHLDISVERAEELVGKLDEINRREANIELGIQTENLDTLKNKIKGIDDSTGVIIKGLGNVGRATDGTIVKITTFTDKLGNISRITDELSEEEALLFLKWEADMLNQIGLAEGLVTQLEAIVQAYDPYNERLALQAWHLEHINQAMDGGRKSQKRTVEWLKQQIKLQEELLEQQTKRSGAIPIQEEIKKLQAEIDAILGKKLKKGASRIRQLKKVKSLLIEIENIQLQGQAQRLGAIASDETVDFEDRKDAFRDLALLEHGQAINSKRDAIAVAKSKYEELKALNDKELADKTTSAERIAELEAHNIAIKKQFDEESTKAHETWANKFWQINQKLESNLDSVDTDRDEFRLAAKQNIYDKEIIALNESYEAQLQDSKNRITLAEEVYEASKKTAGDLRKLNRVKDREAEHQTKIFETYEQEKARIAYEAGNAIIDARIAVIKADMAANKSNKEYLQSLQFELDGLLAAKEQLTPPDPDEEDYTWEDYVDHIKEVISQLGDLFQAFSDRRIEEINARIEKTREFYDLELDKARDNNKQKEQLERERDNKIKALEKERLKEEQKAAKTKKLFSIAEIGINTAVAITKVMPNPFLIALVSALGALQLATVLATPIPQYAEGIENVDRAHVGMINDAGKKEYIERDGKILATNKKNALVSLKPNDTVYKDYDDMMAKSTLMSGIGGGASITQLQFDTMFDSLKETIKEGFDDVVIKQNINLYGFDPQHEAYRESLSNWN